MVVLVPAEKRTCRHMSVMLLRTLTHMPVRKPDAAAVRMGAVLVLDAHPYIDTRLPIFHHYDDCLCFCPCRVVLIVK